MSAPDKALLRMLEERGVLAARAGGGFAVFRNGDRRRRPAAQLSRAEVRELEAAGAIVQDETGAFVLTGPGRSRARRVAAPAEEAFLSQHRPLGDRAVIDADAQQRWVRGYDNSVLRRLSGLRDPNGAPWLAEAELDAARQLRADWEAGEIGLVRGSDWTAPPIGNSARGGAGRDAAAAAHCDARRRLHDALDALAAPLRSVVSGVCLQEEGLETLERAGRWPARSGKLALKLGLAQLACIYRGSAARASP